MGLKKWSRREKKEEVGGSEGDESRRVKREKGKEK